jgi:hypothetical protein
LALAALAYRRYIAPRTEAVSQVDRTVKEA